MKKKGSLFLSLSEIPQEGESFEFNTSTSFELKKLFKDLVADYEVQATFHITPIELHKSYQLSGQMKASMPLICSRCAIDFVAPLTVKLNEIIYIGTETEVYGDRSKKSPHFSDTYNEEAPEVFYSKTSDFNYAEYLHEMLALAEPLAPTAREDCDNDCPNLKEAYKKGWLSAPQPSNSKSPFDILKKWH